MPYADSQYSYIPFSIHKHPVINGAFNSYEVFPVLFLSPNVQIANGLGTKDIPYLLSL